MEIPTQRISVLYVLYNIDLISKQRKGNTVRFQMNQHHYANPLSSRLYTTQPIELIPFSYKGLQATCQLLEPTHLLMPRLPKSAAA